MYLKTSRLEVKTITPDSIDALVELLTDDVVKQTYMVPDFPDRAAAEKLAQRIRGLSENPERYVAGIYLCGQLIGTLNETEKTEERIEVGYAILPRYHNKGYCTEALRAVIGDLFDRGFRQVVAGAFEENIPSLRVMEKSGMTRQDHTDELEYRGRVHKCIYYAATRDSWKEEIACR